MSRCYLDNPQNNRPPKTKYFDAHDDDVDKVVCLLGEESSNLDVGGDGEKNLNMGAKMGIEIGDDVSGSDVWCSGIDLIWVLK